MKTLAALALVAVLATVPAAQNLSGQFSPNPAPPGTDVTFTITDATGGGLNLSSPCTWFTIHQGTQTGPSVALGIGCPAVIVPIAPNGSHSFTWDQRDDTGGLVSPGRYWIEARAWDASFSQQYSDWFCISIQDANAPSLSTPSAIGVGTSTLLTISDPNAINGAYFVALSRTSNNPFSVGGFEFCLSPDSLFLLSLTAPETLVTNQSGMLNVNGENWPGVHVPNDPALAYQGFHLQGLTLGGGVLRMTNDLAITIQP